MLITSSKGKNPKAINGIAYIKPTLGVPGRFFLSFICREDSITVTYNNDMKNILEEAAKIKTVYNPALNGVDISPAFQRKIDRANETLSKLKMPDVYYEQLRKKPTIDNFLEYNKNTWSTSAPGVFCLLQ